LNKLQIFIQKGRVISLFHLFDCLQGKHRMNQFVERHYCCSFLFGVICGSDTRAIGRAICLDTDWE